MNNKKIKVLHVIRSLNPGGIGTFIMNIYRTVDNEKVQFDFAVAEESYSEWNKEIEERGGKIFFISKSGNKSVIDGFVQLKNLRKILTNEHYDAVHTHFYFANGFFLLVAKLSGVKKRVSHCHNTRTYAVSKMRLFIECLMRTLLKSVATDMLGCADAATVFLYGKKAFEQGQAKTVYNGIDYNKWNRANYIKKNIINKYGIVDNTNFVFVGRFEKQKNPLFMLAVFDEIRQKKPDCYLSIIGYGTMEERMRAYISEKRLEDSVRFFDSGSNIPEIMSAMDYMLAPSLWEGLSIAFLEAQAMKVQIYTTSNVSQEVDMGLCSFIPLDKMPEQWAETIVTDIEHNEKRNVIAERKELFDIRNTTKQMLEVYGG